MQDGATRDHLKAMQLAQLQSLALAEALRSILPYAECDIQERFKLQQNDDDETEVRAAMAELQQARDALRTYDDANPEGSRIAVDGCLFTFEQARAAIRGVLFLLGDYAKAEANGEGTQWDDVDATHDMIASCFPEWRDRKLAYFRGADPNDAHGTYDATTGADPDDATTED